VRGRLRVAAGELYAVLEVDEVVPELLLERQVATDRVGNEVAPARDVRAADRQRAFGGDDGELLHQVVEKRPLWDGPLLEPCAVIVLSEYRQRLPPTVMRSLPQCSAAFRVP